MEEKWSVQDVELRHEFEKELLGTEVERDKEWYERFYRKMKGCCETAFLHGRLQGQGEAYEFFSANGNLRPEAPLFSQWQASDEYKKLMGEG